MILPEKSLLPLAVLLATLATPLSASALDLEYGGRLGTGWNLLAQPDDPAGEPTLLHGSAFTGGSFLIGPTLALTLLERNELTVKATTDLLYGLHHGAGFAEHSDGRLMEIALTTHVLRLPLMVEASNPNDLVSPTVALGLEPVVGLVSAARVDQRGYSSITPLHTRPGSSLSLLAAFGASLPRENFSVPFDLRFSFNPFVGTSTVERFDDFETIDAQSGEYDVGNYTVAFNWQIMFTAGLRFTP